MPTNSDPSIEKREFINSVVTSMTVLAEIIWNMRGATPARIERVAAPKPAGALTAQEAARHCRMGRTNFYEAVKDPEFPKPISVRGRKRYRVKDLDRWLEKQPDWMPPKPIPRK